MEKSVAVSNEGGSNHVPTDVVFSILSKLPLKSLKRFGCLSKSWGPLFENSHFMSIYRKNCISDTCENKSLLMLECDPESELDLPAGQFFEETVKLDWPSPFREDDKYVTILNSSSVNGTFCLCQGLRKIALWNPATKQFKIIAFNELLLSSRVVGQLIYHGFGYDRVRNDYKIISSLRILQPRMGDVYVWHIYSLRSNSWRVLEANMPCPHDRMYGESFKVYLDGMFHWLGEFDTQHDQESFDTRDADKECLVSFDFSTEEFFSTRLLSSMDDSFDSIFVERHLVLLNESIALVSNYTKSATLHISVLGEVGVKESWVKLFTFGPLPSIEYPIVVGRGGIFFKNKDDELVWFDLSSQKIEECGAKGGNIVVYKESLLPIEGISD